MRMSDDILAANHSAAASSGFSAADDHYPHPGATLRFGSGDRFQRRRLGSTKHSKSLLSGTTKSKLSEDIHVFQISLPHSGSTLLNCILQGLLEESIDTGYAFLRDAKAGDIVIVDDKEGENQNIIIKDDHSSMFTHPVVMHDGMFREASPTSLNATRVTKLHSVNVDDLQKNFGHWFDTSLYVASTRSAKGLEVDERYCTYPNVICMDYDDFAYEASVDDEDVATKRVAEVVGKVKDELIQKFDSLQYVDMNVDRAVLRVREMESVTKEMIDLPFDEHEKRFGIHGGHRNRNEKQSEEGGDNEEQGTGSMKSVDPTTFRFVHLTSLYSVKNS